MHCFNTKLIDIDHIVSFRSGILNKSYIKVDILP